MAKLLNTTGVSYSRSKIVLSRKIRKDWVVRSKPLCVDYQITFNVEKPLSYDAYKSWSKFGDPNYAEKFCHFSGESSNGETSVAKPILKKNWQKAK
ncbi:MAG: hypothetical protein KIS77_14620 [Saprospiraceae bacterium]|nr:hypothetical protein [Saprospiraceae bacterium]